MPSIKFPRRAGPRQHRIHNSKELMEQFRQVIKDISKEVLELLKQDESCNFKIIPSTPEEIECAPQKIISEKVDKNILQKKELICDKQNSSLSALFKEFACSNESLLANPKDEYCDLHVPDFSEMFSLFCFIVFPYSFC